jgi:alanine-glyoxylate transaminase/serine-glyoxylate transaminase/serine-pyruvate transaminase
MSAFHPSIRTLMGPGPSDVPPRVLAALGRPTLGHLDPQFIAMMDEVKGLLQQAFKTSNELTIPVSAPGSAGMETCFMNLLEPGDTVLICINGVFGTRMVEVAERCGATVETIEFPWGEAVDPAAVDARLAELGDVAVLAFVHAETSTGALSNAKALCEVARKHACLTLVDAVTSLGGVELRVDDWGIDAIYSGSQKCLSCVPGLSPVSFSDKAIEKIKARTTKCVSWFLDLSLVMGYWGENAKRSYHHTAPVNSLYALHESLEILAEQGLEASWEKHATHHKALAAGLESLGLKFIVNAEQRLPQLNSVFVPEGLDEAAVRGTLLNDYNLEIGAGLGAFAGKAWRIGLMGHACRRDNVVLCVTALAAAMNKHGASVDGAAALAAVEAAYA